MLILVSRRCVVIIGVTQEGDLMIVVLPSKAAKALNQIQRA
jgi:hypothetical protein